jgi:hypothetical protein
MASYPLQDVEIPTGRYSYYNAAQGMPAWFFYAVVLFFLYVGIRVYIGLKKEGYRKSPPKKDITKRKNKEK